MTVTPLDLALYAGAVAILFLTPGPVWIALTARALSGGFAAAWPLAAGVVVGDAVWPVLAVLGVNLVASTAGAALSLMTWVAAVIFILLGIQVIRNSDEPPGSDSRLTRPGAWAGFAAGVAVILGNPKAILFYLGVLPGFFDLSDVTMADIAVIAAISMLVPFLGNLLLAAFVGRLRAILTRPGALRRLNLVSGALLIAVGVIIPVV